MDSYDRPEQISIGEDGEQNYERYMDENGVVTLEEGDVDNRGFTVEEDVLEGLDVRDTQEEGEDNPFPESPADGNGSTEQSWNEEFSFSQMQDESRNQDFMGNHQSDDLSFMDQPSMSMTLPSALVRRPPSRDQQLDMTEDEVDQGSSLGAWDGDEEENWDEQQLDYGTQQERLDNTSAGEDQWDNLSRRPDEDEANNESISPSSPPLPSTWDTRLLDMLSLSHGIEDETLPETSRTDSADGSAAFPPGDHRRVSRVTQGSSQPRPLRTKPIRPRSASPNIQYTPPSNERKSKNAITAHYGRGQLNYPLPDFSKVGPRVRFPRDEEGYRPPQPRRPEIQNQAMPALFKSPADIVREVLLSSVEKPAEEPPSVPQEFKTPQQATALVHQLQEDYHKLLTKYAEAENTIDRLRLGAKVHLYSDPAKPSHSVQMGTIMQGSKVMEFTIPHAQTAALSSVTEEKDLTKADTGSSALPNHSATPSDDNLAGTSDSSFPEDNASTLRSHLETLHGEVDLLEGLIQGGNLSPEDQQQAVRELRGSLDVLERRYLQAKEQNRQEQRRTGRPYQELDPQRELEEAIFQLGVQLEELQERIDHSGPSNPRAELTQTAHHLGNVPVPSAMVPVPATQTPYPQVSSPVPPGLPGASSGTLEKEDPAEYLPQPLRHKHTQLERDYGTLLSTYSSFKSLPDALGLEQDEWPQQFPQIARLHDHDGNPGHGQRQASGSEDYGQATRPKRLMTPVSIQRRHDQTHAESSPERPIQDEARRPSPRSSHQGRPRSVTPPSFPPARSPTDSMQASSSAIGANLPVKSSATEHRRASSVSSRHGIVPSSEHRTSSPRRMPHGSKTFPPRVSLSSSLPQLKEQSPRTPTTELSASEESIHGSPSHKSSVKDVSHSGHDESPRTRKGSIAQRRILSPETDSGFLGSESGRSFPLHKQRHQLSLNSREDPVETQNSSNVAGRRLSKNGGRSFTGAHKALRDNRKHNKSWLGQSEASSPSPGPKSLTDSESREDIHTDESDSGQEQSNHGDLSSGASPLPSPVHQSSQHLRNIMENRAARDQAINDLQKEVSQLRHHLENSLNRSPARGKTWNPANVQKQHNDEGHDFSLGLESATYRQRAPENDSREDQQWRSSGSHDPHQPSQQPTPGGKGIQGPYTGTRYQFSDPLPTHTTERVSVPQCQRCQESERRKHVTMKTPAEDISDPPPPPACIFCRRKDGPDNTARTGMTNGESRRHRRHQHCAHWYMGPPPPPPPVSYVPGPFVPYNPPIVYGTPSGVYVPVGYNVADVRSSVSVARPRNPDILELEDLSDPLCQALEAAKQLKTTSKRMFRSLTTDISAQRSLRSSCLF